MGKAKGDGEFLENLVRGERYDILGDGRLGAFQVSVAEIVHLLLAQGLDHKAVLREHQKPLALFSFTQAPCDDAAVRKVEGVRATPLATPLVRKGLGRTVLFDAV